MTERRVADAIVDVLEAAGVRHVFGIPGIHTLALYDALAERPVDPAHPAPPRAGRRVRGRRLCPDHAGATAS